MDLFYKGTNFSHEGSILMTYSLPSGLFEVYTRSCLTLATLWIVAQQAPLSTGLPRQECWSGLPLLSPEDLPHPGFESWAPALTGGFFTD